jgi:hypothetical protein
MTSEKLDQLYSNFKKLSEENQHFIIGYSEGLRQAQIAFKQIPSDSKPAGADDNNGPEAYPHCAHKGTGY